MKLCRRIIAMALALCSLMAFIPASVIAVGGTPAENAQTPVVVTYDFQLENSDLKTAANASFAKAHLAAPAISGKIADYYANNTLNWKYVTNNAETFRAENYTVSEMHYFGGDTNPWSGLRFGFKVTPAINNNSYPVGHWTALELRVENAGEYDINLNHYIRANGAAAAEVYLLPGTYADADTIESAMVQANFLKEVSFTKNNNDIEPATTNLGKKQLMAGTYTIVFKATQSRLTTSEAYIYVKSIDMELQEATTQNNVVYDFSQTNTNEKTGFDFKNHYFYNNVLPDSKIDLAYNNGVLNWRIAANNTSLMVGDTYSAVDSYLGFSNATWSGLRLAARATKVAGGQEYANNHWFAFNLASPGAGKYIATLGYQTRKDSNQDVKVYLLEGSLTDPAEIQNALASATSLTTGFDSRVDNAGAISTTTTAYVDATKSLGELDLKDTAYTLVIHSAGAGTYFFLDNLSLVEKVEGDTPTTTVPVTTVPPTTTEPTTTAPDPVDPIGYSFAVGTSQLVNTNGSNMAGTALTYAANQSALSAYYDNNAISWKFSMDNLDKFKTDSNTVSNTYYFGGNSSYKYGGLRLGVLVRDGSSRAYPAGYWTAFTIKSPGVGNYKIDFGYQTRKDGTSAGEIYVIKGAFTDKAQLEAAIKYENLRQVVDFSSNNSDFSNVQTADLGIMKFDNSEYTVVFYAKSGSSAGAYMHINELVFTATNSGAYTPELPEDSKPVELKPQGYTFEIGASALTNIYGAKMAGTVLTDATNLDALEKYYTDGYISWKYAMDNLDKFQTETNKVNNTYYIGGNDSYKYKGLRLGVLVREGDERAYPAGYWTAFTIKSPGAGNYKIDFGYQTRKDGTSFGEVYIIKGAFTDKTKLEEAIKYENLRQVVDFTSTSSDFSSVQTADLGIMNFEQGEYTVVFRAKVGSAAGAYMHINGLTFTATNKTAYVPKLPDAAKPVELKPLGYSFELGTSGLVNTYGASMAGTLLTNKENIDALNQYYADGYISWKYAADNLNSFKTSKNTVSNTYYIGGTSTYKNAGIRLGALVREGDKKTYPYGYWTAFTLKSPGTGVYYLTLDYQTRADATTSADIYLIKGALTDPAAIEKQLTKNNLLKSVDMKSKKFELKDKEIILGPATFEQGEYTIVFKAAEDSGNKAAYMFLTALTLTHESLMPPPGPNEVIYNFDLHNKEDGIYTGRAYLKDKIPDLAQRYAKEKLNWKYYGKNTGLTDEGHMFNGNYGMSMYTMEGDWMAFKIKSPGPGVYTFTVNHALSGNGALGAIYILPANTPVSEIEKAMDHSNRVGKLEFYNDTGTTPVVNGFTSVVGTFDFGYADEYIMVIEAYDNTPYKNNFAYMWISQVIVKEGDYTEKTVVGQRKIKPIVVNEGACRTMEPTIYLTTAEINGMDYLFMPTEGKKMYIFNLEDMVKVREVSIPFTTCRGIGTDKDGMIWLVGDTSLVHRYDPFTNSGMTTYNYKLNGGIDNSTTAFDLEFDDEGNVYFGTFSMGYVVKYNPQTDKFSKVGGEIHPDAGYACGIEIKDGYLYAAVSGDRNSDGNKMAEVVKIDLATDKIVSRLDIKQQFGDTEVMVRGAGICGDTLFMGGSSMKEFVAIDINTMQLKDYGIPKAISFAPTEVIDGICYMFVPGYGMYEYNVEADTLTEVDGMDSAVVGFRAQKNSSVTLSNNPLFPGTSYITNSGTGLKIYNMQTKQVFTPNLYDEKKDGSGQIIRTIVAGEPGDDHIYVGGFNTLNCAKVNVYNGENTIFEATSAQTDVMLWHEGVLYVGNYNAGNVVRINFDDPDRNVILLTMKSMYHQARVHALAAGDEYLFAGTIPDAFLYGGCLAVINLETQERTVEENLIPNQSITSLAYNDGIVFGGTSVSGGTGSQGSATGTESAVIFAYDAEKKEKIAELDLRKIFPELPDQLGHIDGLVADPDVKNNGKFWGMISETLFSFTFDKETKTFKVKEELSFSKTSIPAGRDTDDCSFAFDGNGYMYVAFGDKGGMRKVNMANPSDNQRINMETPKTFALGADGNLYYSCANAILKMYPLNVTESDWLKAEAVDELILAIDKKVTVESEEAVVAARTAYNELELKHRALVQFTEILEIAETDLLEAKIDAIGEVTLEKREMIEGIVSTYNSLSAIQQKYVKNYQIMNEADLALQALINAEVAAQMQKVIDAIKDPSTITLDDETDIRAVKDQYDALLFLQRQLVDTTKLDAALAKIKELRQIKIDHLAQLIAQIGNVTLEDEPVINEAREIYDWLYMDEREQVDYPTMIAAEKALQKLQKAAAGEVDVLIEAIGDSVTYGSGDAIKTAREAYDALTEGSKKYVTLLHILEEAESIYNAMLPIWAIVLIAVAGVAGVAAAVVLIIKKRKKAVA